MISDRSATELLHDLNASDESESVEAKAITGNELGNSVLETICAFANESGLRGGTILLGVSRENDLFSNYTVTGVADVDKITTEIATRCAQVFNVPIRVSVKCEAVDGLNVLRIDVPEAHSSQKPVFLRKVGLPDGAYRRIGSTDQRCTEDDLVGFFHERSVEPTDSMIVRDAEYEDIDSSALEAYRDARAAANPLAEEIKWNDEDMLVALAAVKKSKDRISITNTGLLCFGSVPALRRVAPQHRIDYIKVPGKVWVGDEKASYESLNFRGPLVSLISRVFSAVLGDLPISFHVDDQSGQRIENPTIPQRVLREALVNAIMHRNYMQHRPIQVIKFSNRLVIKNPGYSLKSEERFDQPGSDVRNPHIAEILHEMRFAEQKGSGIRIMREFMERSGLSSPTFVSDRANDEFSATFLFHHFMSESDWTWLSQFKDIDLSEDQKRALIFVRESGAINNAIYRSLMHVDTLSASRSLRVLREMALLDDRGSGSRTHYVPGPALVLSMGSEPKMDAQTSSMHAKPLNVDASMDADMPAGLRSRIEGLGKRVNDPAQLEEIILELCSWRPLSAEEVATILNKTTTYISNRFLYRLIKEGRLSYVLPGTKHPNQKYKRS